MELLQLWRVIRRRWVLIVIPAVLALVLTLPSLRGVLSAATTYQVGIRFTASQVPSADKTKDFQDSSYIPWLGSEYAVVNLATWMGTDSFAREIVTILAKNGKTESADAIRAGIKSDSARSIMTFYITWPDQDEIKLIADAATEVLQTKNADYFAQLSAQPAKIVALDNVIVNAVTPPITQRIQPLFRPILGLIVGLALAFLAEYLDRTIRDRGEAEAIGFSVLAEIPKH